MILWLNGAFGAGKTSVAEGLCRRLPGAFLYDPENAGQFLRQNLPQTLCPWEDFQDDPLWRQFNGALLGRLAREYNGPVIVPMTVTEPGYWAELTALVPPEDLHAFVLWAEPETLLSRLRGRGEPPESWPVRQIERCCRDLKTMPGQVIPTDDLTVEQVISIIMSNINSKKYE